MAWGALAVLAGRIAGAGLGFLIASVLVPRILSTEDFSHFIPAQTSIYLAALIVMLGQHEVVVRFASRMLALHGSDAARRTSQNSLLWIVIGALVLILPVTLVLAREGTAMVQYPVLFALAVVGIALQTGLGEMLRGHHRLGLASMVSGGTTGGPVSNLLFVIACAAAVLLSFKMTFPSVIFIYVVAIWIPIPLTAWMMHRTWAEIATDPGTNVPTPNRTATNESEPEPTFFELGKAGLMLMASQLLAYWLALGDILIAESMWSDSDASKLASYGAARRLVLFAAMPSQIMSMSILAKISEQQATGKVGQLQKSVQTAALAAAAVAVPFLVLLMGIPGTLLGFVYGASDFASAAPALQAICIGHLALVAFGNPLPVLVMTGRARAAVMVNLVSAGLLVVAGPWAARTYGPTGLATAAGASFLLQNLLGWVLVKSMVGIWSHPGLPGQPDPESPEDSR